MRRWLSDRGGIGLMEAVVVVAGVLFILYIFPKVF